MAETETNEGHSKQSAVEGSTIVVNPLNKEELADDSHPDETPERSLLMRTKGIGLMVLTSIAATAQGSIANYLSSFPTGMVILIPGIYTFLFLGIILVHNDISLWNFPMKKWVAIRVILGAIAAVTKVWSFQNLLIGDASALVFTSPLFTSVIARIFMRRKFTIVTVFSLLSGIAGVALIAKPNFLFRNKVNEVPTYYNLVPLLSALSLGTLYVIQEKISARVSPVAVSFYVSVLQIFTGIGWSTYNGQYPLPACGLTRYLLVLCGFCYLAIFLCMNKALKYENAPTASILRNLDTAFAFIVQIAVFNKPAEKLSVVGAVLIMIGTISLALSKMFNVNCGIEF